MFGAYGRNVVVCADTVVVDRADDDPHDMGKYLTIQVILRVMCCWVICASVGSLVLPDAEQSDG